MARLLKQAFVRASVTRLASARSSKRALQIPDKREKASADALQDRRPTDPPRLRVRMGATATASTNPTCVSAASTRLHQPAQALEAPVGIGSVKPWSSDGARGG